MVLNKRSIEDSLRKDLKQHQQHKKEQQTMNKIKSSPNNTTTSPNTPTSTNNTQKKNQSTTIINKSKSTNNNNNIKRSKTTTGGYVHNVPAIKVLGVLMAVYYVAMMYVRYQHRGIIGFADTLWLCNLAVIFAFISIFINRPTMMAIALNSTFIVHMLWVVDVITYFATGSFPIGNAEYISWPNITWGEIITSTHHAWFVPVAIFCLYRNGGYPKYSFVGSMGMIIPVIYTSSLFPRILTLANGDKFYLNINMVHEFWEDVGGYPFNLIPKEKNEYLVFILSFSATLFIVTHLFLTCLFIRKH